MPIVTIQLGEVSGRRTGASEDNSLVDHAATLSD